MADWCFLSSCTFFLHLSLCLIFNKRVAFSLCVAQIIFILPSCECVRLSVAARFSTQNLCNCCCDCRWFQAAYLYNIRKNGFRMENCSNPKQFVGQIHTAASLTFSSMNKLFTREKCVSCPSGRRNTTCSYIVYTHTMHGRIYSFRQFGIYWNVNSNW